MTIPTVDTSVANAEIANGEMQKSLWAIRSEQDRIAENEALAAASRIRIGIHLWGIRAANGDWTETLNRLGYDPRAAARYIQVGQAWGPAGIQRSDVVNRLPNNLVKLLWLCRIPLHELGAFLEANDCRALGQSKVIALVKAHLRLPPRRPRLPTRGRFLLRLTRFVVREAESELADLAALEQSLDPE